jgi:DNA-binding winged helix-turn-helix (wHTH) protein
VQNGGHLVEKDDLMKFVWPDVMVEEANISLNISSVRKALGDNTSEPVYIATVPKRGYRFIAPVRVITDEEVPPPIKPLLDEEKSNGNRNIYRGTPGQYSEEEEGKQPEPFAPEPDLAGVGRSAALLPSPFGGHLWHALASCTLYALLYAIALFIEVSYQYDRYGQASLNIAPLVFGWIFIHFPVRARGRLVVDHQR